MDNADSNDNHSQPDADNGLYGFQFTGSHGEYFKIWAVNVLLTIITLGIFSAWAKVRTKRYFYANTYLNGANFEYDAKPLSILVARLIVLLIFAGGAVWAGEDLLSNAVHSVLLLVLLPWAIVRGLAFNARYSSTRHVRFHFNKNFGVYLKIYLIYLPIILVLLGNYYASFASVGLAGDREQAERLVMLVIIAFLAYFVLTPWLARAYHRLKASNHRWGRMPVDFEAPSIGSYMYTIWVVPLIWSFVVTIFLVGALWLTTNLLVSGGEEGLANLLGGFAALGYLAYMLIAFMVMAGLFCLYWQGVVLSSGGRVECNFTPTRFGFNILTINALLVIFSLGLLYPYTKIRKARFLADNMIISAPVGFMEQVQAANREKEGALGEELETVEGFDFDVGLI